MESPVTGTWIRSVRQQLGLSQVEFATLLGVTNITVNRWEKDRAAPRPSVVERLERASRDGLGALRERPATVGNLPISHDPLLGRADDCTRLESALISAPLVTIVGAGGAGKTRLALEVARRTAPRFPEGAWFVDLAAMVEPEAVLHGAARVLGVREDGRGALLDRVLAAVRERSLLLILDNCEHLLPACVAFVRPLLGDPGASRIIATSRIPLGLPGETVFPLGPIAEADAVELFLRRARLHQPGLQPDAAQTALVSHICRRLDGLPLAIELAAARAALLSLEQISSRIDERFALLRTDSHAPPRQRALETAIAWSCDLLSPPEASLFRKLGVFTGSFDVSAVEAIHPSPDGLDVLTSLTRQSLLVVTLNPGSPTARYRMLESVAAFARRWLSETGEADPVSRQHATYYGDLALRSAPGLRGPEQTRLLATLDREHDHLSAALEWMIDGDAHAAAVAVAAALGPWWRLRGRYAEGISWLERALAAVGSRLGDDCDEAVRVSALTQLGVLQYRTGDLADARRVLARAVDLGRATGNQDLEAEALNTFGLVLAARREIAAATVAHEAAFALFDQTGNRAGTAASRHYLGNLANLRGDHAAAERAYLESWTLVQGTGDTSTEALILSNLGEIAARMGRHARALAYFEQALLLLRTLGDADRLATIATNTAEVRLVLGDGATALALAADAVAQFRAVGNRSSIANALYIEAAALAATGRLTAALAALRESLAIFHQLNDWIDAVYAIEAIARLFAAAGSTTGADGDGAHAARLLGGADAVREADQIADYPLFDRAGTIALLSDPAHGGPFTADYASGQLLTRPELIAETQLVGALADGEPVFLLVVAQTQRAATIQDRVPATLTARQLEILRLVAAGQSNREIGHALAISPRTVERHLAAIFAVLEVDRRSAAVARAAASGLLSAPDS